jgi:peptidyl-prolyl cis-trans isomerase SurA
LQVEAFFPAHARFAIIVAFSVAVFAPLDGCRPSPPPDVVATVNGKDILRSDLDKKYKIYRANQGETPQEPSAEQADVTRLELLKAMIDDEILQQRAAQFNLVASDEDVNAKLTELKTPYTQEEFDKQLKQRNQTLDDLKRDLRRALTETKLLNKEIESKINITDAEISGYYAAHKAEFNLIEPQYHLAQIVVTASPGQQTGNLQNSKAQGEPDAKKKIQTLHNKLDNGEDFAAVAMMYSEDANTNSNQGDMGFVPESQLHSNPEAYNAISKLKPGQFTDVLPIYDNTGHRTIGYAIYKLIAREPAGQRELNNPGVQQNIRQGLREGHAQLLKSAYFEMLHDKAKVRNYFAEQILKEGAQ